MAAILGTGARGVRALTHPGKGFGHKGWAGTSQERGRFGAVCALRVAAGGTLTVEAVVRQTVG